MDFERVVAELRTERDRINQAIAAIEALTTATTPSTRKLGRGRRRMSAAGRKGIAWAAKKMWAERRKGTKRAPKKTTAPRRRFSATARKRLSEIAKARWAKRRKEGKNRL
jgi:hypothetical protein